MDVCGVKTHYSWIGAQFTGLCFASRLIMANEDMKLLCIGDSGRKLLPVGTPVDPMACAALARRLETERPLDLVFAWGAREDASSQRGGDAEELRVSRTRRELRATLHAGDAGLALRDEPVRVGGRPMRSRLFVRELDRGAECVAQGQAARAGVRVGDELVVLGERRATDLGVEEAREAAVRRASAGVRLPARAERCRRERRRRRRATVSSPALRPSARREFGAIGVASRAVVEASACDKVAGCGDARQRERRDEEDAVVREPEATRARRQPDHEAPRPITVGEEEVASRARQRAARRPHRSA